MKKHSLLCILYVVYCLFSSAHAQQPSEQYTVITDIINKSERDDRLYSVIELDNKMQVLLISDSKAVKSLASIALPIGSLHDPKSQQGLAHYTEHMVLMGSKKYPQPSSFSEYLSQHAGSYNASTALHRTAFYFEVENSAFAPALDRLADAIAAPLLDAKYADKERNAVDSELTMARSSDGFRIGQVDSETINQNHPAAMFSGGNLQTLSDKEGSKLHDGLVGFYQHYYSANLMVGVLYSNQSIDTLANLALETFGRIENHHANIESVTESAITAENVGKMIYMEPAQPKKILYIQFPIEDNLARFADKTDEYISYMISNRSQNTLFDKLQKQELIESISATPDPIRYGTSGVFSIYVSLTDKGLVEKDKVISSIFSYLQLLQQKGVNTKYYDELAKVLKLEFKYPDITRDMSYVEWLADQMLLYPTQHILDADYVATNFNQQSIEDRLKSLTIDHARIWLIAPNQQTDKIAYFVNAPYRIENIIQEQIDSLLDKEKDNQFSLPELNPYIPDDFTLYPHSEDLKDIDTFSEKGNALHLNSQYFADEPKASIAFSLRNSIALESAKNQVMFYLLDYLANRELAQLRFQASVAGMNLSTGADSGLIITASGFNQHLRNMVVSALATYHSVNINEENIKLAKSWYLEKLDAAEHAKSYALAMQPVNALSSVPYFERSAKREIISTITVNELIQYRDELLFNSVPYMITMGNLSNTQSSELYNKIKLTLNEKVNYQTSKSININHDVDAVITQNAMSSDNALLIGFVPKSYTKIESRVTSYLLYKIISPWFYDQLRSNEQLGYAVFALPVHIGDSSGIGFLIQSNQYDPAYLNQRYQAFYPVILDKLNALTDDKFEQYKHAMLNELSMPPQTLDEEFSEYLADYYQSQFSFDSKQQKINYLHKLTKADVINFFQQAVINANGLVIASEVLGNQIDKAIKPIEGLTPYQGAAKLQNILLGEN